jgi:hypothetical protein
VLRDELQESFGALDVAKEQVCYAGAVIPAGTDRRWWCRRSSTARPRCPP